MNTRTAFAKQRYLPLAGLIVVASLIGLPFISSTRTIARPLPTQLADQEFWKMTLDFSEPDGTFRSDNLLSNETWYQYVIPDLLKNLGRQVLQP